MTVIVEPTERFSYEIRSFPARYAGTGIDPSARKWKEAVDRGFHGDSPTDADIQKTLASEEKDGRILTGAYAASAPDRAWDAGYPVATYASYRKTLNVGAGKLLPAHLISAVTVRPTHRRRGLLRTIITDDLRRAKADGLAIAALTASEATIYGRFGFGAATHAAAIEVDSGAGFALKGNQPTSTLPAGKPDGTGGSTEAAGIVELAEPLVLKELEPAIFAQVHAGTFGSLGRQDAYRYRVSGYWNYGMPERDKSVRAALYYAPDGSCGGYVSYKVMDRETPSTLQVVDLLATSSPAHLALWRFLGSIDLVQRISRKGAPVADPLQWALGDKRRYLVKAVEDHLWLRILDPVAALVGRHYWGDGTVTLAIEDPLHLADGVYRLEAGGGSAVVTQLPDSDPADLRLGAAELGQLYLAGVSVGTLVAAGTVRELRAGAAAAGDAVLGAPLAPHCLTDF
ncbi:GNAT family N-acetyltransferase [Paenarthrobacter sp. PH39-S1]|uniref:GNAT family N-acetyltransferase n=1 Tax=Paenarthrobacter sp. PH39-S1 TaxID=3046204 RepID=UPI0024BADEBD|nr:GNAT family N-acetyltransferase [Paenarthrobacter sp. PH39-S1]MDJ0355374.1 GNAT family N-acetyltransferase [Paenarthrobacter sp. PH39-S1]